MDPKKRAQAELDALLKERETELGDAPPAPSDTGTAPAAPAAEAPVQADPAPAAAQPPAAPSQPAPDEKFAALKQQFDTLQGKYNAEVPRLNAELRQKAAELANLRSELQQARQAATQHQPPEGDDYRQLVEEYGESAAKAMVRMARAEATRASAQVTAQHVEPLAASVAEQTRVTFHTEIAKQAGPNWLTVNNQPQFVEWTHGTSEPHSGRTYNELLNEAYRSGDAARVARFFTEFAAATAPPTPKTETPAPAQPTKTVTPQDAMRAPPRRSTPAQTLTDAAPDRVWSQADIDTFYDDQAKGRYVGKEKEAKMLNAEILNAYRDGRVVR